MKLRAVLNEIGDSISLPNGRINVFSENSGNFEFKVGNVEYICQIRFPIVSDDKSKITIISDFSSKNDDSYSLTNQNQPLKVLSFVVGGLEKYIKKWKVKYNINKPVTVIYLKFHAKQEEDEIGNRRTGLYKKYIEKFANRYNSSVNFSDGTSEVIAKFDNLVI